MPHNIISPEPIKSTCRPLDLHYIFTLQKVAEESLDDEYHDSPSPKSEKNLYVVPKTGLKAV